MNDIVTKWEKTGLLQDFEPEPRTKCAESLEELADLLLGPLFNVVKETDKTFGKGFLPGLIIPILVRLYMVKAIIPDLEWLCYDFLRYVKKELPKLKKVKTPGFDVEAELCNGYVKQFEKETKQ